MNHPTRSIPWQKIQQHHQKMLSVHMRDLFAADPKRFDEFSLSSCGLYLDYSKNRIVSQTLKLLIDLATHVKLEDKIQQLFAGEILNFTENRPALHTALRQIDSKPLLVNGINIIATIHDTLHTIQHWVEKIQNRQWLGYDQRPITDIVNIGIGGSDLGPKMATFALTPYAHNPAVQCHFVSNVDSHHLFQTLKSLTPATTLFIIASKTFTTSETMRNADSAKQWLINAAGNSDAIARHFIGTTASAENASAYGIAPQNILPLWDWVGGRYSLWSAVGLPLALAIGMDNFRELLTGANAMDNHFRTAPFAKNMPVILALLGVWYNNFFQASTHAILPYHYYLQLLPAYLQQLTMESNGKQVDATNQTVTYATAPICWGGMESDSQHSFHQLLLQGNHLIPVDFIISGQYENDNPIQQQHHDILYANCLAQSRALMTGKSLKEIEIEMLAQGCDHHQIQALAPHQLIAGNQPSNTLLLDKLSPYTLGALIALYEHKTFVQSIIWNINCFDQWGVELGKKIAQQLLTKLNSNTPLTEYDASTQGLLNYFRNNKR